MRTLISNKRNGANAAATTMCHHQVFDAKLMQDIANEFMSQHQPAKMALRTLPELPEYWKSFRSSLIDTVRVVLNIRHAPLAHIMDRNPLLSRDGFKFYVRSPFTQAVAQVFSFNQGTKLVFEFSLPKFLTGQNLVGIEDMHRGCLQGIKGICKLMGIRPSAIERTTIDRGLYRLTRVDLVKHVDCGTADRAAAMMFAIRNHLVSKAKDIAFYDNNTFYIGQHSKRRSLKIYRKDVELQVRPMPENVYGRDALMRKSVGLVRTELTLRREELTERGLDNPLAWTPEKAHSLLDAWDDRLRLTDGKVPDVAAVNELTPVLQQKFRAWILGDAIAFTRGVTQETYRESRRRILDQTGVDVANHMTPEEQRKATLTIREMFDAGSGYRSYEEKWDKMVEHSK
jgi:Phage replication protein CRI